MNLLLSRVNSNKVCTEGILTVGPIVLNTLERPWIPSIGTRGGTKGISCVPLGIYQLVKHSTEAHPKTWALVNPQFDVTHWPNPSRPDDRTAVLIHVANFVSELRGCIGVGMTKSLQSIFNSQKAFNLLLATVPWEDGHTLQIIGQGEST